MIFLNFLSFLLAILAIFYIGKRGFSRNRQILLGMFLGGVVGSALQVFITPETSDINLFPYLVLGNGYLRFLQMLVFPAVATGILLAFLHIGENGTAVKSAVFIILMLIFLTAISALIGVFAASIFNLDFSSIANAVTPSGEVLKGIEVRSAGLMSRPMYSLITDFIPTNPFQDLAGLRPSSLGASVVFFTIIGFSYLKLQKDESIAKTFKVSVEFANKIMMQIVNFALKITPYGIFGLFAKLAASTQITEVIKLLSFILSSYFAIFVMFIIHGLILFLVGLNPFKYYVKSFSLLSFGFFSRSSTASIPLNIETQRNKLGISSENACISASFGATMGQNGCAGVYPAMLVTMLAPSFGINVFDPVFLMTLILIISLNSFGIAGVGGGAILAGIAVLNTLGMPLAIIAMLAGIEPIIDMARTALNINGSIVASAVVSKINNKIDLKKWND